MDSYFKIENTNQDIVLTPKGGYERVLIFMHGLGDSAMGYLDLFNSNYRPIPDKIKVILLTAPSAAVTINGGMVMNSWYDIMSLTRSEDSVNQSDVVKNSYRIRKVIDNEVKNLKGDYTKIFLGGFSQGACMALHIGLTSEYKLGGLLVLSGLLFPFTAKEIESGNVNKDLNIFIAHGIYDDVIAEPHAKASYKSIINKEFKNLTYKSYDEVHTISIDELEDVKDFLNKLI